MLAEIESVKAAYAALNRNDVPTFVTLLDPQIERIEPSDIPGAGTIRGLEAVRAHIVQARDTWAEGGCTPEKLTVMGDRVVAHVHVRVRLKNETAWREGHTTDVFTFKNGKVIHFRTFFDERQAKEWLGAWSPMSTW